MDVFLRAIVLAFLCVSVVLVSAADRASAQSPLQRLEQQIQGQAGAPQALPMPPPVTDPGYLGVVVDDRKDRGRGVRVLEVTPGGPAAKAGLRTRDLITAVGGIQVREMADLAAGMENIPAGATLTLQIHRGSLIKQVQATLARRPGAPAPPVPRPSVDVVDPARPGPGSVPAPPPARGGPAMPPAPPEPGKLPAIEDLPDPEVSRDPAILPAPETSLDPARVPVGSPSPSVPTALDADTRIRQLEFQIRALQQRVAELEKARPNADDRGT